MMKKSPAAPMNGEPAPTPAANLPASAPQAAPMPLPPASNAMKMAKMKMGKIKSLADLKAVAKKKLAEPC